MDDGPVIAAIEAYERDNPAQSFDKLYGFFHKQQEMTAIGDNCVTVDTIHLSAACIFCIYQ